MKKHRLVFEKGEVLPKKRIAVNVFFHAFCGKSGECGGSNAANMPVLRGGQIRYEKYSAGLCPGRNRLNAELQTGEILGDAAGKIPLCPPLVVLYF